MIYKDRIVYKARVVYRDRPVERKVYVKVPGPERVVYRNVPGPIRTVPSPERVVTVVREVKVPVVHTEGGERGAEREQVHRR